MRSRSTVLLTATRRTEPGSRPARWAAPAMAARTSSRFWAMGFTGWPPDTAPVTALLLQPEDRQGIGPGVGRHLLQGQAPDIGQLLGRGHHVGRFVPFAPPGLGGQIGTVGLHQDPVQGDFSGHLPQGPGLGVGQGPGKGQIKTQVQEGVGLRQAAAETVHDAANEAAPVFPEDRQGHGGGLPGVDHHDLLMGDGELQLPAKPVLLDLFRGAAPVEIQPDLPDGHHLGVGRQGGQSRQGPLRSWRRRRGDGPR